MSPLLRIALAALLGTISYFIIGWLVFEGLLGKYMAAHTTKLVGFQKEGEDASLWLLLLSCMAYALLLAVLFERWAQVSTFKDGLLLGALIGILVAIMTDLYWYSTSHFYDSLLPVAADVLAAGLTVGAMGGLIGWCLGALGK